VEFKLTQKMINKKTRAKKNEHEKTTKMDINSEQTVKVPHQRPPVPQELLVGGALQETMYFLQ